MTDLSLVLAPQLPKSRPINSITATKRSCGPWPPRAHLSRWLTVSVETFERDELVNFVDRQGFVPTISRRQIAEVFDSRVQQIEDRDSANVTMEALRPLAGLSLASVVVRTAERVAAADRKIHPGELRALKLIRLIMMTLPAERGPRRLDALNMQLRTD